MADVPAGTVTFLFTDLEGNTRLLQAHPASYRHALRWHHALLLDAVEGHRGVVFETVGDAVYAAFAAPTDAVAAGPLRPVAIAVCRSVWGEFSARPASLPAQDAPAATRRAAGRIGRLRGPARPARRPAPRIHPARRETQCVSHRHPGGGRPGAGPSPGRTDSFAGS